MKNEIFLLCIFQHPTLPIYALNDFIAVPFPHLKKVLTYSHPAEEYFDSW